jgi:hypothetical protein
MNMKHVPASQEEVYRQKAARRRELASLPIEEKLKRLVRLQQIAYTVARQVGRECRRPWTIKSQTSP